MLHDMLKPTVKLKLRNSCTLRRSPMANIYPHLLSPLLLSLLIQVYLFILVFTTVLIR